MEDSEAFALRKFRVVFSVRREVHEVIFDAMNRLPGWREGLYGDICVYNWNLLWTWSKPKINWNDLMLWQRVNHFPNAKEITRKDNLKRNIQRLRNIPGRVGDLFDITPQTFALPQEYVAFVNEFTRQQEVNAAKNFWIMKPVGLSRGRGIYVFHDLNQVSYGECMVVQRYVTHPMCLDGYKFDLRIYVLVTSFNPLEAFIYKEGFGRLSSEVYSSDAASLQNRFVHLTNSSVNKHNKSNMDCKEDSDVRGGSKLSLTYLFELLKKQGHDTDAMWKGCVDIVLKSLYCCQSAIPGHPNAFEVYGYDIMFDADARPWLIEVNSSPSLARVNKLDHDVKTSMIADTIAVVDPPSFDRDALLKVLERRVSGKQVPNARWDSSKEKQLQSDLDAVLGAGARPRKYGEMPKNLGRYELIAPSKAYNDVVRGHKGSAAAAADAAAAAAGHVGKATASGSYGGGAGGGGGGSKRSGTGRGTARARATSGSGTARGGK